MDLATDSPQNNSTQPPEATSKTLRLVPDTSLAPLYRIWLLRFLVPLKGCRWMTGLRGFKCPALAAAVGLGSNPRVLHSREAKVSIRNGFADQLRQLEERPDCDELPQPLSDNLHNLSRVLKLDVVEQRLLALAVLLHGDERMEAASEHLGHLSRSGTVHLPWC